MHDMHPIYPAYHIASYRQVAQTGRLLGAVASRTPVDLALAGPRVIIRLLRAIELRAVSGRIRNCNVCWIDIVISCLTPFPGSNRCEQSRMVPCHLQLQRRLPCNSFWNCTRLISHLLRAERLEEQLFYCSLCRYRYSIFNFGFRSAD